MIRTKVDVVEAKANIEYLVDCLITGELPDASQIDCVAEKKDNCSRCDKDLCRVCFTLSRCASVDECRLINVEIVEYIDVVASHCRRHPNMNSKQE
jgi:hypothetical protein